LMGLVLSFGGYSLLKAAFIPIAFLVFAIPMPYFIDSELTWRLQIISSQLGVFFIRLFDIPVYLTGNVIDLGNYKLQVAEACSGLRYLYPLLSFGFLAAYLFQAPFWQRATVFFSSIPITIVMNSLRIGIIGVLVDHWGTQQAEGFLHFFEGWIVFIACTAILAAEIWLFARLTAGKMLFQVFHLPRMNVAKQTQFASGTSRSHLLALCLMLLVATGIGDYFLAGRAEIVPERLRFVSFPTRLGNWTGHPALLEKDVEQVLKVDDYILSDYTKPKTRVVNFYVAYYATQRNGASPHSPIVCIPGGGWQITSFQRTSYRSKALGLNLPLNRVVIARGNQKQLVYYWFAEHGRNIANEYWSKWYLFLDAIAKNRTDGALVRLTTPLDPGEPEQQADKRLQGFIEVLWPRLQAYLPAQTAPNKATARHQPTQQQRS
jgi:exosortase D (VPLPA-CTERM-specific)